VSLRTAALILLIQTAGDTLWQMMYAPAGEPPPIAWAAASLTIAAACVLAIAAVFGGAYLVAVVATGGAFVIQTVAPQFVLYFSSSSFSYLSPAWQLPLVLMLLIPLIGRGRVVAPRALNLMLLVPVASVALYAYGTLTQDPSFQTGSRAVWQTLAVAAVLWSVVDERVALTLGLAYCSVVVNHALSDLPLVLDNWSAWPAMPDWSMWRWRLIDMGILAILPVLDIAVGATVAARRARI
jgi:hypothetical protein